MGVHFSSRESSALYGLLAENATDIILKTDQQGFIVHASRGIERLGLPVPNMLIGPHLLDLVHPSSAAAVKAGIEAVIQGHVDQAWVECPALTSGAGASWFELQLRCLRDDEGRPDGTLGIMRSIDERKAYEEKLFAAAMTDPLTGLTNRRAFVTMLQHLVEKNVSGCLAIFDIDNFKAVNMQYGQSFGDEVLVVFSDLLRTLLRSEDIISRIGGECLGVLLPNVTPEQASAICQRIITTLSEISQTTPTGSFSITTSAGVARIGESLDSTIQRAELALFFAKAKGRNRLEIDKGSRHGPALTGRAS